MALSSDSQLDQEVHSPNTTLNDEVLDRRGSGINVDEDSHISMEDRVNGDEHVEEDDEEEIEEEEEEEEEEVEVEVAPVTAKGRPKRTGGTTVSGKVTGDGHKTQAAFVHKLYS